MFHTLCDNAVIKLVYFRQFCVRNFPSMIRHGFKISFQQYVKFNTITSFLSLSKKNFKISKLSVGPAFIQNCLLSRAIAKCLETFFMSCHYWTDSLNHSVNFCALKVDTNNRVIKVIKPKTKTTKIRAWHAKWMREKIRK